MRTNVSVRSLFRYPKIHSQSSLPHALAELILAIGTRDFEGRFLAIFEKEFSARELFIMRGPQNGQMECLFKSRQEKGPLSRQQTNPFRTVVTDLGLMRAAEPAPYPDGRIFKALPSLRSSPRYEDNTAVVETVGGLSIVARIGEQVLCVDIGRHRTFGPVAAEQIQMLRSNCAIIAAAIERHYSSDTIQPISCSLAWMIDAFMRLAIGIAPLSRREAETCARIVLGYSMEATALDLSISKHSAATYRRRAFAKLRIATSKELFGIVLRYRGQPNASSASE